MSRAMSQDTCKTRTLRLGQPVVTIDSDEELDVYKPHATLLLHVDQQKPAGIAYKSASAS